MTKAPHRQPGFENEVLRLGREIFERALAAQPRPWQRAWWLEQGTHLVETDDRLKAAVFLFVECLPALRTDQAIVSHLSDYLIRECAELPASAWWALRRAHRPGLLSGMIGQAARFGAAAMAGRFVTGHDTPSALRTIEHLRALGLAFTLDVLGEFTTSESQADRYARVYHGLMDELCPLARDWPTMPSIDHTDVGPQPRVNLSLKLTGLHPHFDAVSPRTSIEAVGRRLRPLLRRARGLGAFVNIDMESYKHRDLTLDLFESILMDDEFRDWSDVGIVVQAYLRDGENDLARLLEWGRTRGSPFAIRLVKGAYWDSEVAVAVRAGTMPPVWTRKWESDACYERMAQTMLDNRAIIRPCFASHNVRTIAAVMAMARHRGLPPAAYEFQMLYGMGDPLKTAVTEMGRCVRVYSPYGDMIPGMGYLIRRLLENTSNDSFLRQGFADRAHHDHQLADPARVRPPSSPLPRLHYQDLAQPVSEEPTVPFMPARRMDFTDETCRTELDAAFKSFRNTVGFDVPLIIGGRDVATDDVYESVNPATPSQTVARVARGTVADVDVAVATAYQALPAWRSAPVTTRCALARQLADRLESRRAEVCARLVFEAGLPCVEADAEIANAIDICCFYADQMERLAQRPRRRDLPGENNVTVHLSRGVCAVASTPAAPLASTVARVIPPLLTGSAVVLKPADPVAGVADWVVRTLLELGCPPGVIACVPGPDAVLWPHLASHPQVHVVVYSGSRADAATVHEHAHRITAGQDHYRHTLIEPDTVNTLIVDEDADLAAAVTGAIASAFTFAGRRRACVRRIVTVGQAARAFRQKLAEAVGSVRIGAPEDPGVQVGPVLDADSRDRLLKAIRAARAEDRLVACGDTPDSDGYYVPPTVVEMPNDPASSAATLPPGPVVEIATAPDFASALTRANADHADFVAGLYSRSPSNINRAERELNVGSLFINRPTVGAQIDRHPFGAFKHGGAAGRLGTAEYLFHFLTPRAISEYTLRHGFAPSKHQEPDTAPLETA